jgi:TonB family protein
MEPVLRAKLTALLLFLMGLQACTFNDKVSACLVPIVPTHTLIPYPPISQRLGEQGTTIVTVGIGKDGAPVQVRIDHGSGSKRLDAAAVSYILERYRWQRPPEACKPAATQTTIIVAWRLDPPVVTGTMPISAADYPPGAEILESHVKRLDLQEFSMPAPVHAP